MMFCCLVVSSLFFLMVDAGCDTALRREICYLLIRPMTPAACINYPSYSRKSFLELQSDVVAPRTPLLLGAWRHGWGILKVGIQHCDFPQLHHANSYRNSCIILKIIAVRFHIKQPYNGSRHSNRCHHIVCQSFVNYLDVLLGS